MTESWERLFVKPSNTIPKRDLPAMEADDVPLLRLQTETRVDYLNQIKKEGKERVENDIKLREEMHSFGVISCGFFDPDTKIVAIDPGKRESVSVPVKVLTSTTAEHGYFTFNNATEACLLEPGKKIVLKVYDVDNEHVLAHGTYLDENEPYTVDLEITKGAIDSGTAVIAKMKISLSGAVYKSGAARFPDISNPTTKEIDVNTIFFFK